PAARMDLVADRRRQVLRIEPALLERGRGQRLADVLRQPRGIGRVRRDRREGLEVHREAFGRALGPELRLLRTRERVVRGVVLDDREMIGVEAKALVRLLRDALRVPPRGDERGVGPRARADLDARPGYSAFSGRYRFGSSSSAFALRCDSASTATPNSTSSPTNE